MAERLFIEGYADQLSVPAGGDITLHVSTNMSKYSIEIGRVGMSREIVWEKKGLTGVAHPIPVQASSYGCDWPPACRVSVSSQWNSGYYNVILKGEGSNQTITGEIAFVVRAARPGKKAKILLQRTTNTDNAYNSWGGYTLYSGPDGPTHRVSFDRPYAGFLEDGIYLFNLDGHFSETLNQREISDALRDNFLKVGINVSPHSFIQISQLGSRWYLVIPGTTYVLKLENKIIKVYDGFTSWESGWRNWEYPFVFWAEQEGYEIDYAVNTDLEFNPEILKHYKLVLSVGHDEYWSAPMRDHIENYVEQGGNLIFFSGNNLWWQVRSEDNGRALVCWKDPKKDPYYGSSNSNLLTTLWCHHLVNRPENYLTGVSFSRGGYYDFFDQYRDADGCYTVHRSDHWIFEGTGLRQGDQLGGKHRIVGYECDGCDFKIEKGLPIPTGFDGTPKNFEILATAPAALSEADDSVQLANEALYGENATIPAYEPGAAVMGLYERGGTVFTTGCTEWTNGLRGHDKAVECITHNLLKRLSN
jgi:hypothetical protein